MTKKDKLQISLSVAIIAAIFVMVIGSLLLLNYWQISKNDPLESIALKSLLERSFNDQKDVQIREEIRHLDLMARKAFFTYKWQIKTGTTLLILFSALFLIALRYYFSNIKQIPMPNSKSGNEYLAHLISQKWILTVGALVIILAVLAGFYSKNYLDDFDKSKFIAASSPAVNQGNEPVIEVIEISRNNIDSSSLVLENKLEENTMEPDSTNESKPIAAGTKILTSSALESNYNSFRGPWGNGVVSANSIPTDWDLASNRNIVWKTKIPKQGYNSPIIWADKLFVAGADKLGKFVYCLDRFSGAILWQREVKEVMGSSSKIPNTTDDTGLSAASLTTDGVRVYAIFANGDLAAFDFQGNQVWSRSLGIPDNHYGHSSSLLVWGKKLFVQFDSNRGGKLFAINTESGELVWQIKRNSKISWSSPIIAEISGQKQLVLTANPIVAGYNLKSGDEIWSVDCLYGEVGPSAAYGANLIFAANEYAKLVAIDPSNNYEIKWEADEYLPEVSSPVVSKGLLFIATSYGVLVCYDALNGEKYWEQEYSNGFYSSPIVVNNRLYLTDMGGITHIIEVDKNFKLISEPKLGEKIVTTPAFAEGKIYFRGMDYLYCIGK